MFCQISVSFACLGLNIFRRAQMPMVHIKIFKIPQGVWDIMKEPMWTCDVNYITQNNSTIVSTAMHVSTIVM